ncbi:MAG: hypothetical protein MUE40_10925, partial [Anaerolineae bacterium]|nr:hypothetical protein [Anaerolineae bacterium]
MPPTTLTRLWQRLLQWLLAITTPAAGITHEDTRRRIRLILAIDLVLVLANGLAVLILLAVLNEAPRTMLLYILPSLLAMVMGIAGYGLARTRRYVTGMQITLAGLLLNSYGAVLVTPGPEAFNYTIVIGAIPLVSSLFLSVRRTAVISAVVVAGLALVLHFHDALTRQMFENYMPLDGFARFISLLTVSGVSGVVLIAMRLRDLLEQDRLRAQEKALAEEMRAEAYKSADQVKTVFFASLSHELRTPLNAVINFTRLVTDGHAG